MPAGRPARQRAITNENDENVQAHTARMTRAKANAASMNDTATSEVLKKPLQSKKTAVTTSGVAQTRKRAALGDVSNVAKGEAASKKALSGKAVTAAKASQPTKVQKPGRSNSTRSVLGNKDKNATSAELKRPASGSGVGGHVSKKRNTTSQSSASSKTIHEVEDDNVLAENVAPVKRSNTVSVEVKQTVKAETREVTKEQVVEVKAELEMDAGEEVFEEVHDLDFEDMDDPLRVAEYVGEIFEYLKELEIATQPNPSYMDSQRWLDWSMRSILVDWLIEVHIRFQLLPETLFLAVNIIDRFLSCKVVQLDRLQLVGVTAMLIACKYEEVIPPHISSFRLVADDGFTDEEILSAERFILGALNYDLSYPNPMNFLRRVSKADNLDVHTRTFGKYLLEISCLDHKFMKYPPSQVSACAIYLARLVFNKGPWDATLAYYAGYSEEELQPVFELMVDYLKGPMMHEAFFKKYASKRYFKGMFHCRCCRDILLTKSIASIILRQWAKRSHHLYLSNTGPAEAKKPTAHKST